MLRRVNAIRERVPALGVILGLAVIAVLLMVLDASAGANVWTPLDGPTITGGDVEALVLHPAASGTLYAVANSPGNESVYWGQVGKVFKSTDGASTWRAIYTPDVRLQSLAVTGTTLYAGGWGHSGTSSIYRSTDGGTTWNGVFTTTGSWNCVYTLAIDPVVTSTVHAAGMEGPATDQYGYAYHGAVYRSTNDGADWTRTLTVTDVTDRAFFYAVAVNPVTPTLLLASGGCDTGGFVYRSDDGGLGWTRVYTTPSEYDYVTSLAFHPLTPTLAYAASGWPGAPSTLYRSQDGGLTWSSVLINTAGAFALEPPNTIYVVGGQGKVRKSTDGGDNWAEVGDCPDRVYSLLIDPIPTPSRLYLGLYAEGVFVSSDGGANWNEANSGLELPLMPAVIAVDPKRPDYLYTAAGYPGGFRSTDGGETWQQLQGVPHLYSFAIHPLATSIVYAGAECPCATIYRSSDSGLNWTGVYTSPVVAQGGSQAILALAVDPITPSNIYACGMDWGPGTSPEGVILRSTGGGDIGTWTRVYTVTTRWGRGFDVLAVNPITPTIVYAAGEDCSSGQCTGTLYRTTDSGQNWTPVLTSGRLFRSLVIDRWHPNEVYIADESYAVYKSDDGGDNWVVIRQPPQKHGDPPSGSLMAIDPRMPACLYLAGMGWVGQSRDGGDTWETLDAGLPSSLYPTALTLDSNIVTRTLYLGGNGMWVYSQSWFEGVLHLPLVVKDYVP